MAWKFLSLRNRLQKKEARYDDCPRVCGQTGKAATEFCKGCPILKEDKRFRKETLIALDGEADGWKEYGFDFLQTTLFAVMELEEAEDLYEGTQILANIVKIERRKIERIENQNLLNGIRNPAGKPGGEGENKNDVGRLRR